MATAHTDVAVSPSSPFRLQSLPLPSTYGSDLSSYRHQWKVYRENYGKTHPAGDATIINSLAFVPSQDHLYLVACTSTGHVYVWNLDIVSSGRSGDDDDWMEEMAPTIDGGSDSAIHNKAILQWQVEKGALLSARLSKEDQRMWLVLSGDGGVHLYDWEKDIAPQFETQQSTRTVHSVSTRLEFEPHPSPSSSTTVMYDSLLDSQTRTLYTAAGDAFGCYKFDLQTGKVVSTYKQPSDLRTLALVGNQLLTGGASGEIGIWDTQTDRQCDVFHSTQDRPRNASTRHGRASQPSRLVLSSMVAHDDQWWSVAGTKSSSSQGGTICTWHGPSRSMVSTVDTREAIQGMVGCDGRLVTAGNESQVSHWEAHACSLSAESSRVRVPCPGVKSVHALALHNGYSAVAGVGRTVVVFQGMNQCALLSLY